MAAQILSFTAARAREPASRDWSRQELAEFYRVESALVQAGLQLESDRGLSDEGDPWFVFCRADTGEVFIHFARVDGWYVVDGAAFGAPARGRDFGSLVRDLIASHPLATVRRPGSNVMLHPAALLIALVGAAFFHSGKAKAAEPGEHAAAGDAAKPAERRTAVFNAGGAAPAGDAGATRTVALDAAESAAVLAGVAIGLRVLPPGGDGTVPPSSGSPADPSFAQDALRETGLRAIHALAPPDALSGLSAADARAALTVMAVFHDLARGVAASSTTTTAPSSAGWTSVTVDTTAHALAANATMAAPAAVSGSTGADPVAPLLVVHLASGPLPQIEALAVVQDDGALAHVLPDHLVHVDQLPQLLADLIAHGDIVAPTPGGGGGGGSGGSSGGATPPEPPIGTGDPAGPVGPGHEATSPTEVRHPVDPAPTATPGTVADDASHTTTPAATPDPAPAATASPPVASDPQPAPDPVGVATPTQSSPPPTTAPVTPQHNPQIDAAVLAFVTQVSGVQVMISGHEVVFYDPAILGVLAPGAVLDSITWRMEDGSTVSLVGTASELHAFHGVG